jgi:hypothetical protein
MVMDDGSAKNVGAQSRICFSIFRVSGRGRSSPAYSTGGGEAQAAAMSARPAAADSFAAMVARTPASLFRPTPRVYPMPASDANPPAMVMRLSPPGHARGCPLSAACRTYPFRSRYSLSGAANRTGDFHAPAHYM